MDLVGGLHARPASMLADTVRRHHSSAALTNLSTGAAAEARSVLSMIGLDIQRGHTVLFEAFGDDEEDLLKAIKQLVARRFGEGAALSGEKDTPTARQTLEPQVPPPIAAIGVQVVGGTPVSRGTGVGSLVRLGTMRVTRAEMKRRVESVDSERERVDRAFDNVRQRIESRLHAAEVGMGAEILRAHVGIITDPALRAKVEHHLLQGRTAACAVIQACEDASSVLQASSSRYIRDRVADVDDICRQVVRELDPALCGSDEVLLAGPSVVVAETLGVSQLMGMDRTKLKGLVLGAVGETSHTVIMARSMQVPTLVDVQHLGRLEGATLLVDAIGGYVLSDPPREAMAYFERERVARVSRRALHEPVLRSPGRTKDGVRIEVGANAAGEADVRVGIESGADGIGLLRTELLFVDQPQPPDEDRQFAEYQKAIEAAGERTIIFRTLDIGGDKPAPYLSLPEEDNPFLGERGIRLYAKFPGLIRSQVRAICRASGGLGLGRVRVMAPMVATVAEARWFAELVTDVQRELASAGVDHDPNMQVGVMVEVPSATEIIDQLAQVVDFLSIGTNDLAQYWSAADRTSAPMALLNHARQPALLRVLRRVIREAKAHRLWVGICGEMAADPLNLPLIAAMGPDEISVSSGAVAEIKARLARIDAALSKDVLERALACETVEQVDTVLLEVGRAVTTEGPLALGAILPRERAASKYEAIHKLTCALHASDRALDPRELERKVWAREATYATAMGHGFAIPHARAATVACATIGLLRLETGVEWGGSDAGPVDMIIMIAVPDVDADQTHLKILAKLARRLMHERFREDLRAAPDAAAILNVLRTELDLG